MPWKWRESVTNVLVYDIASQSEFITSDMWSEFVWTKQTDSVFRDYMFTVSGLFKNAAVYFFMLSSYRE